MILENTLKQGSQFLKKNNISSHQLDAQIILSNIMKVTKEYLILNNVMNVSDKIRENTKMILKEESMENQSLILQEIRNFGVKTLW